MKQDLPKIVPISSLEVHGLSADGVFIPFTSDFERENPEAAARMWKAQTPGKRDCENLLKSASIYSESPIEEALLWALLTEQDGFYYEGPPILATPGQPFEMPDAESNRFVVMPQFKIGEYRVDIAVVYTYTGKRFAVECDGHEFHEKTREQAARDKARDRFLTAAGWPPLRFSGSEIHADAYACAAQVTALLRNEAYLPDVPMVAG